MGLQIHLAGLLFIVVGLVVWVIGLGGLAAATSFCHAEKDKHSSYEDCASKYQWEWWGLWFEFFLLLAILFTCATRHFKAIKLIWISYMTMCTVVLMMGARNFITDFQGQSASNQIKDYADAARGATAAGFVLMSIVNFVIIIFLSLDQGSSSQKTFETQSKFSPYMASSPFPNSQQPPSTNTHTPPDAQFQASSV